MASSRRYSRPESSLAERLEAYTERRDDEDACWPWTGALHHEGYGRLLYDGRLRGAHVWVYVTLHGEPPVNKPCILHTCDNRACVNPRHLYAGTHVQNMDDMARRHRQVPREGMSNPSHKLTDEQVHEIRELRDQGLTQSRVAFKYGVSQPQISAIWNRRAWKHLPERSVGR